jgi:hypothetical protein
MFQPNIYGEKSQIITDIVRLIIVIILMFLLVVEILAKRAEYARDLKEALSSKMLLSLFIFFLYVISFSIKLTYCYQEDSDIYSTNGNTYIDTYSISGYYNQIYFYESLLFAAVSIKILYFLVLNDYVKLFFSSIELGIGIFVKYSIFFLVILLGYSCIAHILWGPYIKEFNTFGDSFLQILLFTMGYFNSNLLLTYNSAWTVAFLTSFFLFVLYFMYAVFVALYAESLRRTVIKLGYPEDHELSQWTLKDYVVWLCYCIGSKKKQVGEENN